MLAEDDIRQIEAWLDGALDPAEQAVFENRLRDDPGFAAEVVLHQKMRLAVGEKDVGAFRKTVENLLLERRSAPQNKFVILRYIWALAAALLLALAAVWFYNQTGRPTPEEVYAAAFQPPEHFEENGVREQVNRGDDSMAQQQQKQWAALNTAWGQQQYEQALALALEIAQKDSATGDDARMAFFVAGVIALAQENPEDALQYLQRAEGLKINAEEIRWYTTLALVKQALQDRSKNQQAMRALEKVKKESQPADRYPLIDKLLKALAAD